MKCDRNEVEMQWKCGSWVEFFYRFAFLVDWRGFSLK